MLKGFNMSELNAHKFAFIMCSNNEEYLNECFNYLTLLKIPEGFEAETFIIPDAKSMASGYNEGMRSSDAKYKIYLHQDSFIRNRNFLNNIIEIFASGPSIGMIGMLGAKKLSQTGVMWNNKRVGNFYCLKQLKAGKKDLDIDIITKGIVDAEVADGHLLITQYDLPWREDIFDGWDFYDVSQCLEFRRAGYRIVIPGQDKAWCIHDCRVPNTGEAFEHYRRKLLSAYRDFFPPRKRFMYANSDIVNTQHIVWGLLELKHDVTIDHTAVHIQEYDERGKDDFAERMKKHCPDYVITFDMSPEIARACYEEGIPYISWAYDSPLKEINGWFAIYPTTHAFCMDKKEMERIKAEGKKHAHLNYMHLAANVTRMQGLIITEEDEKKYSHDISMVGNLYDMGYYESFVRNIGDNLNEPQEFKDRAINNITEFIDGMAYDWRRDGSVYDRLPEETVNVLCSIGTDALKSYNIPNRRYYEAMLAREITHRDRVGVLSELAKLYDVHLYTRSTKGIPEKVHVHDPVDPYVAAPKVYHLSKINLNITLRSIETGTPLRIFDVMSVGGFMMSNYQRELDELFVVDKEIVLYESMDELKEKVKYYLKHEDKRRRIAVAGYEKVKQCYSYPKVLEKIIKIVDSEL